MSEQRFTCVVTETDAPLESSRFVATLGDYDEGALMGYGSDPASAIINWIEMWEDKL